MYGIFVRKGGKSRPGGWEEVTRNINVAALNNPSPKSLQADPTPPAFTYQSKSKAKQQNTDAKEQAVTVNLTENGG